jgi:hypothetical protein
MKMWRRRPGIWLRSRAAEISLPHTTGKEPAED